LLIPTDVTPVLAPINSVVSNISPIAAQVAILAQRERRSQHCKHYPTNDSSSHIASLVFGPFGLCDLEHTVAMKVLGQLSVWKGRTIKPAEPEERIRTRYLLRGCQTIRTRYVYRTKISKIKSTLKIAMNSKNS
jgi:hypothetical protein